MRDKVSQREKTANYTKLVLDKISGLRSAAKSYSIDNCFEDVLQQSDLNSNQEKVDLIQEIKPQYVIIKPSLVGGWQGADQWVSIAERHAVDWWATSALESNIGLNAIAQWVSTKQINLPQGLGTGGLFTNNIDTPLYLRGQKMGFDFNKLSDFTLKACL